MTLDWAEAILLYGPYRPAWIVQISEPAVSCEQITFQPRDLACDIRADGDTCWDEVTNITWLDALLEIESTTNGGSVTLNGGNPCEGPVADNAVGIGCQTNAVSVTNAGGFLFASDTLTIPAGVAAGLWKINIVVDYFNFSFESI